MSGSAIFGRTRPGLEGAVELSIVGPTDRPLVDDRRDRYQTALPVLGAPFEGTPEEARDQVGIQGKAPLPIRATGRRKQVAPEILRELETVKWRLPDRHLVSAQFDHDADERIESASVPPATYSEWTWPDRERLEIVAVVTRPDELARKARRQFLAAVFLGLGGGFVAWTLELAHQRARRRLRTG